MGAIEDILRRADEVGIKLEIVNGLPIWEAHPAYRHQRHVERIAQTIRPVETTTGCKCIHALDIYIQFPNGIKRPDISIFCEEPPEEQQDEALTIIPEAVVEVVSKGYEAKDLEIAPAFYLSQGVKDVVVFDPSTFLVLHVRKDSAQRLVAPAEVGLECGCIINI